MISFRPLALPTLWFVPGLFLLIGLGVWQTQRLGEKQALIASIEAGMKAQAVPLAQAMQGGAEGAEWRQAQVRGHFLNDKEAYVFAQGPRGAVGVQVMTPLVQDNGETVLVERGFVPEALRDPKTRAAGQIQGEADVTGVLRLSQSPGAFTPAPDLKSKLWFVKNLPEIAAALGVTVAPVFIDAGPAPNPGGWPLGGQTHVDIPNDHLQYAITWFGLALALTAVYLIYHRSRGRLGFR